MTVYKTGDWVSITTVPYANRKGIHKLNIGDKGGL